jgi:hypothetical protein
MGTIWNYSARNKNGEKLTRIQSKNKKAYVLALLEKQKQKQEKKENTEWQ